MIGEVPEQMTFAQTLQMFENIRVRISEVKAEPLYIVLVRKIELLQRDKKAKERSLENAKRQGNYTHCQIDPSAIFGVSASVTPYPTHNQGNRLQLQAAMVKAAYGDYHPARATRLGDGRTKVLQSPSRPMIEPVTDRIIGLSARPQGQTVIIAIGAYTGFNQEDSFIFNQASIDRGLFRYIKFFEKETRVKSSSSAVEVLRKPPLSKGEPSNKYEHIDESGLPRIGSYIRQRQCVIGKVRTRGGKTENASVLMGSGEEGYVNDVWVIPVGSELRVIVKMSKSRRPVVGDKFAPRYSQKGTIGKIFSPEKMPFTQSGLTPDIIINPHGITGRMTIGYMIEILTGRVAFETGQRLDASAFRNIKQTLPEMTRILKSRGLNPYGNEVFYSAATGEKIEMQMFAGPVFTQALNHHVYDKIQMRSNGLVIPSTHQPGKPGGDTSNKLGGPKGTPGRTGEMERDCFLAHGVAAILSERLCTLSDAYQMILCKKCGTFAYPKDGRDYVCPLCDSREFGRNIMPYVFKYLMQLLATIGIRVRFKVESKSQRDARFALETQRGGRAPTRTEILHEKAGPDITIIEDEEAEGEGAEGADALEETTMPEEYGGLHTTNYDE